MRNGRLLDCGDVMSYELALEAAGAKVVDIQDFGDYQGTWIAKLEDGRYVSGEFGSCSGCDAFEGEFGYHQDTCSLHSYSKEANCSDCLSAKVDYDKRLTFFGQNYLEDAKSYKDMREEFAKNASWDSEASQIVTWLDKHENVN
jgi:hypothetical protein